MDLIEYGPIDSIENVLLDSDGHPMGWGRPPGLHLGHLLKRLRKTLHASTGPEGEQEGARMLMGFVWETLIDDAFGRLGLYHPEGTLLKQLSIQCDGIWMTPDGLYWPPGEPVPDLLEYKATWRTMRPFGNYETPNREKAAVLTKDYWFWTVQIMAYLHGVSESLQTPVRTCRLWPLFVEGDYSRKPRCGPQVRGFGLRFTDAEVAQNWAMLLGVKEEADGR